jgi:anti-sigma factor RsiW
MSTPRWLPWRRGPAASPPGGLVCAEMVELVTEYLEGALATADHVRFETHIAACAHCSAYLEQMRMTLHLLGHIEPDELDPEIERALLDAFKDWKAGGA